MDKETLVRVGHDLLERLDDDGLRPKFAMWVLNSETQVWKLWIVPEKDVTKKEEDYRHFFRKISQILSEKSINDTGIDVSAIQLVKQDNPAVKALGNAFQVSTRSSIHIGNSTYNGYYMLDGIVLRSELTNIAA